MLERKPSDNFTERLLQEQLSETQPVQSDKGELQDDCLLQEPLEDEIASEEILARQHVDWNALQSSGVLSLEHVRSPERDW